MRDYSQEAFGLIWKAENYTEQDKNEFKEGVLEALIENTINNGKMDNLTDEEIIEIQDEVEHDAMVKKFAEMIGGKGVR